MESHQEGPGQQEAACDAQAGRLGWEPSGALTPGPGLGIFPRVCGPRPRGGPRQPGPYQPTRQEVGVGSVPGGLCGQNLVRPE